MSRNLCLLLFPSQVRSGRRLEWRLPTPRRILSSAALRCVARTPESTPPVYDRIRREGTSHARFRPRACNQGCRITRSKFASVCSKFVTAWQRSELTTSLSFLFVCKIRRAADRLGCAELSPECQMMVTNSRLRHLPEPCFRLANSDRMLTL